MDLDPQGNNMWKDNMKDLEELVNDYDKMDFKLNEKDTSNKDYLKELYIHELNNLVRYINDDMYYIKPYSLNNLENIGFENYVERALKLVRADKRYLLKMELLLEELEKLNND